MRQATLPFPLAHSNDQITSYRAGERIARTGELSRQEREVHQACKDYLAIHVDFTAKDIAGIMSVKNIRNFQDNYYKVQRRFSGLHRKGFIERTDKRRDDCCVWRLVDGN